MDCVKWGNDNKEVKDLPLLDEGQAANPNGIEWQDGFDSRFTSSATKFPTKENIDDMLAFISAKHFFKKCGGMHINVGTPSQEYERGNLPTIERSIVTSDGPSLPGDIWRFLTYCCFGSAFFFLDEDGNIGLRESEVFADRIFLNPKNKANMESAPDSYSSGGTYGSKAQSYDLSVLGSPEDGVCSLLKTGDTIYFQEEEVESHSEEHSVNTIRLVDRALAEYNGSGDPPSGFTDFPYFFQAKETQFCPVSGFSELKEGFPYNGVSEIATRYATGSTGGNSIIDLYQKRYNDTMIEHLSKINSIVDPDDATKRWYLVCHKVVNDCALIFDFQPFLNVVKYTSYGDNDMVKEVATFDNGCVNLKRGYYHNLYMSVSKTTLPLMASWNPPYDMSDAKPILIASGGQLLCDRIFLRRGSMFNFFLDTNAPVDFRFKATAIPLA